MSKIGWKVFGVSCLLLSFHFIPAWAEEPGAQLFQSKACVVCHGENAEGNERLGAPALAGQDLAYLKRQLGNFKNLARGYDPKDSWGRAMQAIAYNLSDQEANDLAVYLNKRPPAHLERTVTGVVAKGGELFKPCAACHGENARGNPTLNAPSLVLLNDYYIITQLENFKTGTRGKGPGDTIGAAMPAMAATLSDQDRRDVAAYIFSLRFKKSAE